jgi:hypothetical protein
MYDSPDYVVLQQYYNPTYHPEYELDGETRRLPYGNGCHVYHDCFTCPLKECVWTHRKEKVRSGK